jgi:hypothetical protein
MNPVGQLPHGVSPYSRLRWLFFANQLLKLVIDSGTRPEMTHYPAT